MIPVDFTIDAKNDLFDAVCYYESKEVGLGVRLRDEILMMLDTAAHAPICGENAQQASGVSIALYSPIILHILLEMKCLLSLLWLLVEDGQATGTPDYASER